MKRSLLIAAAALGLAAPAAEAEAAPACAGGSAAQAAESLYGGELVGSTRVAGLQTALALEPRIAPGTRRRMVRTPDGRWCDVERGFNAAAAGLAPRAQAVAFARLAAAPYFDGVTVREVRETLPGTFAVTTHARTNGVVARWVVVTDRAGVRAARWTATEFAVAPFEGDHEGLTALPGAGEAYERVAGGGLQAARGLPTAAGAAAAARAAQTDDRPGVGVEHITQDRFRIVVSYGDTRTAPRVGQDTGVRQADVIRRVEESIEENYDEFHAWGLRKGWVPLDPATPEDTGYVYINDALSAVCLACVFIADDFQIHLNSEVTTALELLGYSYPDERAAFSNVVGHEMFHNFQNRYNKPGELGRSRGRGTSTAYSEGTARFQETLHEYAPVSHQPGSLVYADNANGCNGFDGRVGMDAAMAAGIFGKTYNACFFWMAFYKREGLDAFRRLVTEAIPAVSPKDAAAEGIEASSAAAGDSFRNLLVYFARAALTGRGLAYAPLGGGSVLDWSAGLERWQPATLAPGGSVTRRLTGGGLMAAEVPTSGRISLAGPPAATLHVLRSDGRTWHLRRSARIGAPRPGVQQWVVATLPADLAGDVTLTLR